MELNNLLTDSQLTEIIESAEAVLSAMLGTNDDVHPESHDMIRLWDKLNDVDAQPAVVLAMAREIQERRKAATEPVAWRYRFVHTPKSEGHGSPFTTDWKFCDSEDKCNPSDCFERQALYTNPQPLNDAERADVEAVVMLLGNNEWAEHCTETDLGKALEGEVTRLYNAHTTVAPGGLCFSSQEDLARAIAAVRCFDELSAELIAEEMFKGGAA